MDGGILERFEASAAEFYGARHAVATCNGTASIHLALFALDNLMFLFEGEHDWNADDLRTFNTGLEFGRVLGLTQHWLGNILQ